MSSVPVLFLLVYNGIIFLNGSRRESGSKKYLAVVSLLFFCSGMPALIYQIVWQRALLAIYGVNAESVAVVVSAFMLGLGLGSLLGGYLSSRYPDYTIIIFGLFELTIALFGLTSLHIFHWAAMHTAGAPLVSVVFFSLALLLVPTICMGATLPLLVEHLVQNDRGVGYAVGILYFVNTFGSAVACYLCAAFLLRDFGQTGSVQIAAFINVLVAGTALILGRIVGAAHSASVSLTSQPVLRSVPPFRLIPIMGLAAFLGFIALGFELLWFRLFVLASWDRAPAFALLLSTYLAGIAAGAYIAGRLTQNRTAEDTAVAAGMSMLIAAAISSYLTPLVAMLQSHALPFLLAAPAFFVTAALIGSVFPVLCRLAVPVGSGVGQQVSFVYVANIVGSTCGSLLIGFVLMNHFGLGELSVCLGLAAFAAGCVILFMVRRSLHARNGILLPVASLAALVIAPAFYDGVFEKLSFGPEANTVGRLKYVLENRNGVVEVTQKDAVYGSSVYDGYFNIDPFNDVNGIVRAFALSVLHPNPKHILMIGLSSGSWAQVLANHPQVESLEVVEINPGYLKLISKYPALRSVLKNPKVHIHIDDGRRWLLSHPNSRFDIIVANTTFFWRDHSSGLLSAEFLRIVQKSLNPGGIYYYNTTGSDEALATGLSVFPFGVRLLNVLAVSDSPIVLQIERWMDVLRQYEIDGRPVFDSHNPKTEATLHKYRELADSLNHPPTPKGLESSESLRVRLHNPFLITDDNMGWEWRTVDNVP